MPTEEREQLLTDSVPEDPARLDSPRYAFRVGAGGLEWFAARCTRVVDGEPEFHGYPCSHVPIAVLRRFRELNRLTEAQYRRLIKELL
jgi:hypothetical protein